MAPPDATTRHAILIRLLRRLLRPLARVLIANGVTLRAAYAVLKQVYVEVAERDFAAPDAPLTDSRIQALTGVHRKDIRAIREARRAGAEPEGPAAATALVTVVSRWLADPALRGPDGAPRPLPRQAADGPSFDGLAASVTRDMRPRTLLDELARQGVVTIDPATELVTLDPRALIGPADFEHRAEFFARNIGDHLAAAAGNLLSPPAESPFLERAVFYNRLAAPSVDRLESEARRLGVEALERLNREAYEAQARDAAASDSTSRFRFGVFFYREDEAAAPAAGSASDESHD